MIYLICFIFSLAVLIYLVANGKGVDINAVILNLVVVLGNGGYYALYESSNLTEAVLANKVTYTIGCFAPMIMFLIICKICRISINIHIEIGLYILQVLTYLSVCTTGRYGFFYRTIQYAQGNYGAQLIKTYGPMHAVYIACLCFYMVSSILIVGKSLRDRSCSISTSKANILLFLFLVSTILYFVERFAKLNVELMPVIFTVTNFFVTVILVKISCYSASGNLSILEGGNKDIAYIVFNRKLMYMSCNDYALELFPEFEEWEIESKIPGNGGRFNTFLRIPFMKYVEEDSDEDYVSDFEFKGKNYRVEISSLTDFRHRKKGYTIKVALDVVKTRELAMEDKAEAEIRW